MNSKRVGIERSLCELYPSQEWTAPHHLEWLGAPAVAFCAAVAPHLALG